MRKNILAALLLLALTAPSFAGVANLSDCDKEKLTSLLFNGIDPLAFFVYLFYGYVGMVVSVIVEYIDRTKADKLKDPNRPVGFSIGYWWRDNKLKTFLSLIMIPISIVFCSDVAGVPISNFVALLIGGGSDKLAIILKSKMVGKQ